MPQLTWIGKDKVKNHHHDIPFHLLKKEYDFKADNGKPENSQNNMLIQGDNLLALKSLLPKYEGKINCIYIDPPYNTGNEKWVYNDNVNDPRIKKWLGEVVGKEGEDLSRHDKWLCMMYPRLKLLHRLLADDGVIFISIDDIEIAHLRLICDEIFGYGNFVGNITRATGTTVQDTNKLGNAFDSILVYAKTSDFLINGIELSEDDEKRYNLEDENGKFSILQLRRTGAEDRREDRPSMYYPIISPDNTPIYPIGPTGYESRWRVGEDTYLKMLENNEIYFKNDNGEWKVYYKYYLEGRKKRPSNLWTELDGERIDGNKKASRELKEIFNKKVFDTPKPVSVLEHILTIATSKKSLILDSFIGSATTAHAVLNLNTRDGGSRQFIGIEMMDYAETITAERIRKVINGYGSKPETQKGTGGGFSFYTIGETLFDSDGNLNNQADLQSIREYIAHSEKLETVFNHNQETSGYFLGKNYHTAYVFYYEPDQITTLSLEFLRYLNADFLSEKPQDYIIYADKCTLSDEQLAQFKIRFKRIPRDISKL
ncbi:site-specific DNA-methyltransferase [Pasteurella bettyae]|jgi:adenine-specific DNA-methyltransferase|uniref:site-specific DNA-methyltransferase n=1 Tax=Pasteurella bettyae TaxID=752 RepID=UPI003D275E5D